MLQNRFVVETKPDSPVQFFPLRLLEDASPMLGAVSLTTNFVTLDTETQLDFSFLDPSADMRTIGLTRSNWTGVVTERLNALDAGLGGLEGAFSRNLRTPSLAFGGNASALWFRSARDRPRTGRRRTRRR